MTKVSILIDNYNYSDFLKEAIGSALNQTYDNTEIIIVDDGSTDSSAAVIKEYADKYPDRVKAVFKENGGQASAFNAGFAKCTGDIICLLDSDDLFEPEKAGQVAKKFEEGYEYIYNSYTPLLTGEVDAGAGTKQFPYNGHNLFLVYYMSKYPGDVASTLSFARKLGEKIFPIENEHNWKIQADDWIVFSAGMMAKTCFLDMKLTKYRIHGDNLYYNKPRDLCSQYKTLQNRSYIKDRTLEKMNISKSFMMNGYNLAAEFRTHEKVDFNLLKLYYKVLFWEMPVSFLKKLEVGLALLKRYREKKGR